MLRSNLLSHLRNWRAIVYAAVICVTGQYAESETLPPLPESVRAEWAAVGRVNGAGVGLLRGCTGTLIAPDLVLTAAHCTGADRTIPIKRHFIGGWDRGDYVAHRLSEAIVTHPAYTVAKGDGRFAYDVALVWLEEPIPSSLIEPLPLAESDGGLPDEVGLIGYHNQRPHLLNGRFDCASDPTQTLNMYAIKCEVIGGNSGGPVVVPYRDGWAVTAVIVARAGPLGHALAVPVGDWILEHWRDAMARADR